MTVGNYIVSGALNGLYVLAFGLLPYVALAFFMQLLSKSLRDNFSGRKAGKFFIYITAPGVIVHELGHILFCYIFGHKVLSVKLFSPDESGTLGYVNHRYNPGNFYHKIGNFFIGTGPVWFGVAMIFLLSWFLLPAGMVGTSDNLLELLKSFFAGFLEKKFWIDWKSWLWLYLSFSISAHITLSKADLNGAMSGLILVIGVIFLGCILLGWCGSWEERLLKFELHVLVTLLAMMISFFVIFTIPSNAIRLLIKYLNRKKPPVEEKV